MSTEAVGPWGYPHIRSCDQEDQFFGTSVQDPYRYLEDPDSSETKDWISKQRKVFDKYFGGDGAQSLRATLREEFEKVYEYEKVGSPFRRGDSYYFFKNDGLQNQDVLYKTSSLEKQNEDAQVFLDLNEEFPDGTTSLACGSFSEDGKFFAYGLSIGGSDWVTIKVREAATGKDLEDRVSWVKFSSIEWLHDNSGFFYACFPAPEGVKAALDEGDENQKAAGTETGSNKNHMICFHRLGTNPSEDKLVYSNPENPQWVVGCEVTDDGNYLLVLPSNGCDPVNRVYYVSLQSEEFKNWFHSGNSNQPLPLVKLIDNFDAGYDYVANDGLEFYMMTNKYAPKYRLVKMQFPETEPREIPSMADVLPEEEDLLEWVKAVGDNRLLVCRLHDVTHRIELRHMHHPKHPPEIVQLPAPGCVAGVSAKRDHHEFFFKFVSFTFPGTIFRYELPKDDEQGEVKAGTMTEHYATQVPGFVPDEFETWQDFAESTDGTKIPYFVVRKKGSNKNPKPCILYGYGGFSISVKPSFAPFRLVWMKKLGGAIAVANIRGGGEYGERWHKAGSLLHKKNCFDDFCSVGEALVNNKITSAEQLAIMGGSNGGLLVLASALRRPELFRVGIAQVPVADMLRFHRFTIGHAWCTDYGCADNSQEEFEYLYSYSPLHNVYEPTSSKNQLPSLMLCTADHDDRVVPLHSFKMTSALQMTAGKSEHQQHPLIIRIEEKAGHGAGKPTSKILDEVSDVYTFIATEVGATI
eukprot:gb/GECG01008286.1/.p1 GENE.gb/GECG01008286.1/~~gb/GECG01008286.1/.p1  ORF type:complete len:749 (+),score=94.85 gb/GECG01008286.1/:1-2247(+)